ncbi:MAG: hypothetical protein ACXAEU_23060, partial [Candidatus Hodarchaeales archaeon]
MNKNPKKNVLRDFLALTPTSLIAQRYNIPQKTVKRILRENLGYSSYMKIAHRIGANVVAKKIKSNLEYREKYVSKMKKSVSKALTSKMKD